MASGSQPSLLQIRSIGRYRPDSGDHWHKPRRVGSCRCAFFTRVQAASSDETCAAPLILRNLLLFIAALRARTVSTDARDRLLCQRGHQAAGRLLLARHKQQYEPSKAEAAQARLRQEARLSPRGRPRPRRRQRLLRREGQRRMIDACTFHKSRGLISTTWEMSASSSYLLYHWYGHYTTTALFG
jgi:hypothetical protein